MKINWKVRLLNKAFWLAIVPAVIMLIQAVCAVFGISFDAGEIGNKIIDAVEAVFMILAVLGIVNDPTTAGIKDSDLAMTYKKPKGE